MGRTSIPKITRYILGRLPLPAVLGLHFILNFLSPRQIKLACDHHPHPTETDITATIGAIHSVPQVTYITHPASPATSAPGVIDRYSTRDWSFFLPCSFFSCSLFNASIYRTRRLQPRPNIHRFVPKAARLLEVTHRTCRQLSDSASVYSRRPSPAGKSSKHQRRHRSTHRRPVIFPLPSHISLPSAFHPPRFVPLSAVSPIP